MTFAVFGVRLIGTVGTLIDKVNEHNILPAYKVEFFLKKKKLSIFFLKYKIHNKYILYVYLRVNYYTNNER